MKILTFTGRTPSEALKKAKMDVNYAQMLHIDTKEIQKKSLGKEAIYEIVMGVEEESMHSTYKKTNTIPKDGKPLTQKSADVLYDISYAAKQISKIADVKDPLYEYQENKPQSTFEPKELKEIKSEIAKLGDKVKIIQNMFWDEKAPELDSYIPSEFAEIYRLSSQSGMNREHLDAIMRMTLEHMPFRMRENSSTVKRYFQTLLRKMVPIRLESTPSIGNKKVIMLVGPTGVGKTTSVAKLAARYSYLMQKKYKVGLVVLDTYRIGAVEQLMQYARMMKLGIETVVDPIDFASALDSLRYCDYILIDTMGSSPYDKSKIEKIYECLDGNDEKYNIDVVLVMPSSIKYEDLKATYENFSSLNVDTLMFTKLDETRGFGNIFSLAYDTKKPISYFSVGQEVPEDLVCASSDFLVECLLHGFNRSKA
ncbi:MAG: flagellar biosynthesis protein FlhF [Sulfurimonas sp. RIFOXYD12_FULL_33_39]|uniref:flagellar biosynthesis protein FlhF n=1 Tax=unclassified Sulfurimonas TaxID=2623549 RepID=UPI0008D50413|nr:MULTISPECIES: flagellar biosynthesis protein FlhF [unclassified Sulfurimonas]OHE05685.1 MAG: flagellar biosynthesis protein FlhF [Sulfurimonas sp. RIFCSPLOWO2_12_FULL_34_6]OHE10643.1 MAG: flagellar biosynthesis protein FlhF [Sulfurimonas sp. RIFOXYD12_FULL_33_39]OHE13156.1 MAG: flagellar biosynthesis protein FlhF [Sulfurimonas sp. RIFOXYD2_FULL_34_21]DAB27723.1 MAG TPA: flagellar biosynthesis protein FlhF [Sulfurimonas sp. UBA10385]